MSDPNVSLDPNNPAQQQAIANNRKVIATLTYLKSLPEATLRRYYEKYEDRYRKIYLQPNEGSFEHFRERINDDIERHLNELSSWKQLSKFASVFLKNLPYMKRKGIYDPTPVRGYASDPDKIARADALFRGMANDYDQYVNRELIEEVQRVFYADNPNVPQTSTKKFVEDYIENQSFYTTDGKPRQRLAEHLRYFVMNIDRMEALYDYVRFVQSPLDTQAGPANSPTAVAVATPVPPKVGPARQPAAAPAAVSSPAPARERGVTVPQSEFDAMMKQIEEYTNMLRATGLQNTKEVSETITRLRDTLAKYDLALGNMRGMLGLPPLAPITDVANQVMIKSRLDAEVAMKNTEISRLQDAINTLRASGLAKDKTVLDLERKIITLEQQIRDIQSGQKTEMNKELQSAQQRIQKLEQDLAKFAALEAAIETAGRRHSLSALNPKEQLSRIIQKYNEEIDELNQVRAQLANQIREQSGEITDLRGRVSAQLRTIEQQRQELERLGQTNVDFRGTIDQQIAKIRQLEGALVGGQEELERRLAAKEDELRLAEENFRQRLQNQKRMLDTASLSQKGKLEKQYADERAELNQEIARLKNEVLNSAMLLRREKDQRSSDIQRLSRVADDWQRGYEQFREGNQDLQRQLRESLDQVAGLQQDLANERQRVFGRDAARITELEGQLAQRQAQVTALQLELREEKDLRSRDIQRLSRVADDNRLLYEQYQRDNQDLQRQITDNEAEIARLRGDLARERLVVGGGNNARIAELENQLALAISSRDLNVRLLRRSTSHVTQLQGNVRNLGQEKFELGQLLQQNIDLAADYSERIVELETENANLIAQLQAAAVAPAAPVIGAAPAAVAAAAPAAVAAAAPVAPVAPIIFPASNMANTARGKDNLYVSQIDEFLEDLTVAINAAVEGAVPIAWGQQPLAQYTTVTNWKTAQEWLEKRGMNDLGDITENPRQLKIFMDGQSRRENIRTGLGKQLYDLKVLPLRFKLRTSEYAAGPATKTVATLPGTQRAVTNDLGTVVMPGQPNYTLRRQGLNYVVHSAGRSQTFASERDANYFVQTGGFGRKTYGPVTERIFGTPIKNLSKAVY